MRPRTTLTIFAAGLAACSQPKERNSEFDPQGTTDVYRPDIPEDDEGSSSGGEDGNPKHDLPSSNSTEGCKKVDFLFVVDASPSMDAEQAALLASFPGFIDAIRDTLGAQDYHLLVTDVDAYPQYTPVGYNEFCEGGSCCGAVCAEDPQGSWCDHEPCGDHTGDCDFTLGAGKNDDDEWASCGLPNDRRWLSGSDPNLEDQFACVARVGTYGYFDETQAAAIEAALSPELNSPGGCNEGFLRDDAILVVTVITDEEDLLSPGSPQQWRDRAIALKGGNEDAIVMLGLVGDYGQPGSPCSAYDPEGLGAQDAPRLRDFVEAFDDRGLVGSVCASNYVPFFEDAVSLIDTTCIEFTPAG